jgi:hypothetical protein
MAVEQDYPNIAAGELTVDENAMQALTQSVRGSVLRPGEDGFDSARHIWNGMIDRSPGAIVRCTSAADVIAAVNFARSSDSFSG